MEKSTITRHRLLSYSKVESKVSWFVLFFWFPLSLLFAVHIRLCSSFKSRSFSFPWKCYRCKFIHYVILSHYYTNPFRLLSFSCSDIFTDTKNFVHTIYRVTYLKYTFNTEHEYSTPIPKRCIHTYIHRLVAYKRPQNYSRKRERNLRLNPYMHVAYLAYSCRRYADQRNR